MGTTLPAKSTATRFKVDTLPYGMQINSRTGVLSGMPYDLFTKDYDIMLTATNDYGETTVPLQISTRTKRSPIIADQEYYLTCKEVVKPIYLAGTNIYKTQGLPVISSPASVTASIGDTFQYYIATDWIDKNKQIYSIANAPEGMTVNAGTGLVTMKVPAETSLKGRTTTFTVRIENSVGSDSMVVSILYIANEAWKPVIYDVPELTFMREREIKPVVITGANITVNAGPATITSEDSVYGELGGTLLYQITTNYKDPKKQVYFLEDAPLGMVVNEQTGIVSWEDIPPNTETNVPIPFTIGTENSYGVTYKQVTATIEIPESYKPVIEDQEVVVIKDTEMSPYSIKGSNLKENSDDWRPVIEDQEITLVQGTEMSPYKIKGTNIYANYGRSVTE